MASRTDRVRCGSPYRPRAATRSTRPMPRCAGLSAIDWVAKRPLGDRDRLALVGASMGGQVALLTAAHKPPIRAVASYSAPADLARWREANPFVRDYLDDLCGLEGLPVRSPISRVAQTDAPVMLAHGDKDENVP